MNINFKNVLAGVGTAFIIISAIIVGLVAPAYYPVDTSNTIEYLPNSEELSQTSCGREDVWSYTNTDSLSSVTYDKDGYVYITDLPGGVVRKYDDSGNSSLQLGAPLTRSSALAIDDAGNIYVANMSGGTNPSTVFKFNKTGIYDASFSLKGGPFFLISDVEIKNGYLYIAESSKTGAVKKFNLSSGNLLANVEGFKNTSGTTTKIAVNDKAEVFVISGDTNKVLKYTEAGSTFVKSLEWGGTGNAEGKFGLISGITIGSDGNLYVTDSLYNHVQVFDQNGKFLYQFGQSANQNGGFNAPKDITLNHQGKIVVLDNSGLAQTFGPMCGIVSIEKDAQPNTTENFLFLTDMSDQFRLADKNIQNPNKRTFGALFPNVFVAEGPRISGGTEYQTTVICADPSGDTTTTNNRADIKVSGGEEVKCLFINKKDGLEGDPLDPNRNP